MASERENILSVQDYDVAGNAFRAYYDADKKLVFVLDFLVNDIKPNVLLVINPDDNRKWDDILENDYGVDLETVRPKKDNKYQKLDIEYTGLNLYGALVRANENGDDLTDELNNLNHFRRQVARRVATERLENAQIVAENARETIEKANEKTAELQEKLKKTRTKLTDARRNIGKEPTKQSAAKILRMESQVDTINEQIKRAKKRAQNAARRELSAQDDIDEAQKILKALGGEKLPATPIMTDVAVQSIPPVPVIQNNDETTEPKAKKMDDDVKPLFNKDPEILDDEIAFKPIEFNVPAGYVEEQSGDSSESEFVAPTRPLAEESETVVQEKPALDVFAPVALSGEEENNAVWGNINQEPVYAEEKDVVVVPVAPETEPGGDSVVTGPAVAPVVSVAPVVEPVVVEPAVAPIVSELRPVSPVAAATVSPVVTTTKPTMLYYVMLIALIVLSVFTLWLYQNSSNDALPELGAKTAMPVAEEVATESDLSDSEVSLPFVEAEPEPVESVVVEPVAEEPAVAEPVVSEPVIAEPVTEETVEEVVEEIQIETVTEEPVVIEPVVDPVVEEVVEEAAMEPVVEEVVVTEPVVDKPAYNVSSQNEKMFVAPHDYETDVVVETEIETCADGNAPDVDGCCTGEALTQLPDGEMACCSDVTGECFPPML